MHNGYWFVFLIIMTGCSKETHKEYHSFNDGEWCSDSIVSFEYNIFDTIQKYDLSIMVRHTVNYEFQNLFVFLEEQKKDTIEIILANKTGKWIGSGISDIREVEYIFETGRVFDKKGLYTLKLEQAMRYGSEKQIEKLPHILDIGLIVSMQNE